MNWKITSVVAPVAMAVLLAGSGYAFAAIDTSPPASPVKLIFIHHSSGENWLVDDNGGLGVALRDNNYFVSDTNYGWGPDGIGDRTDIGNWYDWFVGPSSPTYLAALYAESGQNSSYTRLGSDPDPGGENQIVMFKSCFPNSYLGGNPDDPPTSGANPLRGQDASSSDMTVANAKGIYNDILGYFGDHQDKLFVAVTAPPLVRGATDDAQAANARAFNNWLVNDWLAGYSHHNVAVFDFYNVLTSNGGDPNTNDAGAETGNHHRIWEGSPQHIQTVANNMAAYGSTDSHATPAGNRKATQEFPGLLNAYYHCWTGTGDCPTLGPRADFIGAPRNGYAPLLVQFTDLSSGSITGWQWDFGDSGTSAEQHPTHLYAAAGTYTVTLTVTRTGGATDVKTETDYVTATPNPYGVTPAVGCNGTEIHVTGPGFGDSKGRASLQYRNSRGRLTQKSLKILSWADALITARVGARMEPRLSDVIIRPYRQAPVLIQNVFTAMAPAVDSITPGTGSPGDLIALAGHYFGADKPKVQFRYLVSGRLRQTRCKVTAWAMNPTTGESSATFTVPDRLTAGTYDVVVSSKIGSMIVEGGFTVP
jgi:PKD repeat protein